MILGIDVGTQSLKAVVVDDGMNVIGEGSTPYQPTFPKPGWADQDPSLWEQALKPSISKALSAAGIKHTDIKAIGIGGQLDGCVPVDGSGNPVGQCLIWLDRRAFGVLDSIDPKQVLDTNGIILDATHMAAKIRWLKKEGNLSAPAKMYHQPVSYLVSKLTGEHVFDHGLASTTMVYSLENMALDPALLDAFEIAAEELPRIDDSAATAGVLSAAGAHLTGLPAGIPVAVGTGDDFSSPLGAGVIKPGEVACVLGTAEVVGAVHTEPAIDHNGLLEAHGYAGGRYFIENPGWFSGGSIAWLQKVCRIETLEEFNSLAAAVAPGCDDVLFLPALSGAMAPEWIAEARGAFYGLTPSHETGHFVRAVLEGCAHAMRDVVDRLDSMGVPTDKIVLVGGGARSEVWARIRADLTGRPVEMSRMVDTSPIGGAILGAVAAGIFPDVESAASLIDRQSTLIEPNPANKEAHDKAYTAYRELFESLKPMYK
jgi:xylulokinase